MVKLNWNCEKYNSEMFKFFRRKILIIKKD